MPAQGHAGEAGVDLGDLGGLQQDQIVSGLGQKICRGRETRCEEHPIIDAQSVGRALFAFRHDNLRKLLENAGRGQTAGGQN